ncbi:hypothetical protein GF357_02270 [Candidatus Dojkabacteria bacterium]|nr:hypothetical protein [Candidatus Dojkabacteria bacterium]
MKIKLQKKDLLRVVVLVVLLGAATLGLVYAFPYIRDWWLDLTTDPVPEPTNKEIAVKVLDWMNENRDKSGRYLAKVTCKIEDDGMDCNAVESNQTGAPVIWAKFKHFEAFSDEDKSKEYLAQIDNDLDVYLDQSKVDTLQINFWNCRFLQEIYLSDKVSESIREKALKMCSRNVYNPLLSQGFTENFSEQEGYYDYVESVLTGDRSIYETADKSFPLSEQEPELISYAVYASDEAAQFKMTEDDYYLERAEYFANQAASIYVNETAENRFFGDSTKCILGVALLDLYRATANDKYIRFASEFGNNGDAISTTADVNAMAVCGMFYNEMFSELYYDNYLADRGTFVVKAKREFFDYDHEAFASPINNFGAFYEPTYGDDGYNYSTVDNSLLVYLLVGLSR